MEKRQKRGKQSSLHPNYLYLLISHSILPVIVIIHSHYPSQHRRSANWKWSSQIQSLRIMNLIFQHHNPYQSKRKRPIKWKRKLKHHHPRVSIQQRHKQQHSRRMQIRIWKQCLCPLSVHCYSQKTVTSVWVTHNPKIWFLLIWTLKSVLQNQFKVLMIVFFFIILLAVDPFSFPMPSVAELAINPKNVFLFPNIAYF